MSKVLITTVPFGKKNNLPIELLRKNNIDYLVNPFNKKLTEEELIELVSDFDVIIAGTESITKKVMDSATNLKMISRVGIGLDSVDLLEAKKQNIVVSYTPDAPAPAVSELTLGFMLTLLRSVHVSNMRMHNGDWHRFFGKRLSESTIGIIGLGRIGLGVLKHLQSFNSPRILVNDIDPDGAIDKKFNIEWATKEEIYQQSDVITIHVPLTSKTSNMVTQNELRSMKDDACIINTSRGGIVNEDDLYCVMKDGHLGGAAIDVFNFEPYNGKLKDIERCILTSHMGSMSVDCRAKMEIKATEEAVRFLTNQSLTGVVPIEEYKVQEEGL